MILLLVVLLAICKKHKRSRDDLATYTPLRVGSIASELHVRFAGSVETLKLFLTEMYMGVTHQTIVTNDDTKIEDNDGDNENDNNEPNAPVAVTAPTTTTTIFGLSDDQIKVTVGGGAVLQMMSLPMLVLSLS